MNILCIYYIYHNILKNNYKYNKKKFFMNKDGKIILHE